MEGWVEGWTDGVWYLVIEVLQQLFASAPADLHLPVLRVRAPLLPLHLLPVGPQRVERTQHSTQPGGRGTPGQIGCVSVHGHGSDWKLR